MKDAGERRKYDLLYPSLKGKSKTAFSQNTQEARPSSASTTQSSTTHEAAQIAALQKSKQERATRWRTNNSVFESSIFEAKREIRRLEQNIKALDSILAAEAAVEAQKNSWSTWLLSPIYKKAEESEEEKARKDRARQERRVEKDMKERRLEARKANLKTTEQQQLASKATFDTANLRDDVMLSDLYTWIWNRDHRQRQEREKAERDRRAEQMRQEQQQREKREREAAETLRKQQAAQRAAQQKRYEEELARQKKIIEEAAKIHRKQHAHFTSAERTTPQSRRAACHHDGWWPKVQGRTACPECYDVWLYLLQCPGCAMMACPKCQAAVRPKRPRGTARGYGRVPPRARPSSPEYGCDDYF